MSNQLAALRKEIGEILESKNHSKVPSTIEGLFIQYAGALALGKYDKADKYKAAIIKFANALVPRKVKDGIELVDSNEIPVDVLKNRALVHAKRVRELAILREKINDKEKEVQESLSKIPDTQLEQFKEYLQVAQNAAHALAE